MIGVVPVCRSKMDAMHQMKASNQKVHEADLQRQSQQEDLDDVDQQIATLMGETQKLEAKRTHHRQADHSLPSPYLKLGWPGHLLSII